MPSLLLVAGLILKVTQSSWSPTHKWQRDTETERDQELGTVACSSVPSGHYQSYDRCELLYLPHFAQRRAEEMLFDLLLLMQGLNVQDL